MKIIGGHGLTLACIASAMTALGGSAAMDNNTVLPPISSFSMSTNLGVAPFTVAFTDTSRQNPAAWFWTFGDGGTSTLQNPSHTFTNMWRQMVALTVSNANGATISSQPVFQCFPCDAVYDWTNGIQGQPATLATLSNSLVGGAAKIGFFTITNFDLPSPNLQGIIFTNLPGVTNGCPVVFPSGVVYSDFNTTNALAYCWTNGHEQYDFHFNSNLVVTNVVLLFYDSMPLASNVYEYGIDELNIATTRTYPDLGLYCMNRELGCNGPLLRGPQNDFHTSETCVPTTLGHLDGTTNLYQLPNKLYRILMAENTNGDCILAVGDPATSSMVGFVTNFNGYEKGHLITAYADGHTSYETFTNNGLGEASFKSLTSILAYHSVISINRPLTWSQVSNVVMYGP